MSDIETIAALRKEREEFLETLAVMREDLRLERQEYDKMLVALREENAKLEIANSHFSDLVEERNAFISRLRKELAEARKVLDEFLSRATANTYTRLKEFFAKYPDKEPTDG